MTKLKEFHTVFGMLAARTGEFLNYSNIAKNSGVKSVTVKDWCSILEHAQLIYLLKPIETNLNNLNKRLTKAPKIYFLDTGLAARLQGWQDPLTMIKSPQAGHLFETLVLAEIIKLINSTGKNWNVNVWRTKDGEEIDFIITKPSGTMIALDAKMGIHSILAEKMPRSFLKAFPQVKELVIVSIGGKKKALSKDCLQVPIKDLYRYLLEDD